MRAAYAAAFSATDPLGGLVIGEREDPIAAESAVRVRMMAASVNRHDLWTLSGVSVVPVAPPVILGCDGAGYDPAGAAVTVFPVLGHGADFHMLTDGVDGTWAEHVCIPATHAVPKPRHLTFEEAAVLGTTWLTAWAALTTHAHAQAGQRVLVQGATGGLSGAAIQLAASLGLEVVATTRSRTGRELALRLGAHEVRDAGAQAGDEAGPPVDVVIDSVGAATWSASLRALRPGGHLVCLGATSGADADAGIRLIFRKDLHIHGAKMGTLAEFHALCAHLESTGLRPDVATTVDGLDAIPGLMRSLADGGLVGKAVVRIGER